MTDRSERMIEDLKGLINIPSVSSDKAAVSQALDYVLALGTQMGMRCEKLADGQIGAIEIGRGDETLGILTHVDVVDGGNGSLWDSPPFSCEVRDGRIYGRGALDDKGPTIAVLHAMDEILSGRKPLYKKVRLIIGTQEEAEWTDMECYTKNYALPDYGFTPDGDFPIGNVEKGCMDIVLRFPAALAPEDAGVQIVSISAGTAANIVPDRCTVLLSDGGKIVMDGKAAHTCAPEKGRNAIFLMHDELKRSQIAANGFTRVIEMLAEVFGDIYGSGLGILEKEAYFDGEYIHRTVFTPSLIKTQGQTMEVSVNVRFAYTATEEELLAAFGRLCEKYGGEIAGCTALPPVFVKRSAPFLKALAASYEEAAGLPSDFILGYGGSYAKAMPNIVSFGPILPGMEDNCHEENECLPIEGLMKNFDIYCKTIDKIAGCRTSFLP